MGFQWRQIARDHLADSDTEVGIVFLVDHQAYIGRWFERCASGVDIGAFVVVVDAAHHGPATEVPVLGDSVVPSVGDIDPVAGEIGAFTVIDHIGPESMELNVEGIFFLGSNRYPYKIRIDRSKCS